MNQLTTQTFITSHGVCVRWGGVTMVMSAMSVYS